MYNTNRIKSLSKVMLSLVALFILLFDRPASAIDVPDISYMAGTKIIDTNCDTEDYEIRTVNNPQTGKTEEVSISDCEDKGIDIGSYEVKVEYAPFGIDEFAKSSWVRVGDCQYIHAVKFCNEVEGDRACLYGYPLIRLKVGSLDGTKAYRHCTYLPPPKPLKKPPMWSRFVSQSCYDYGSTISKAENPFTSVVVQCVDETMRNIFNLEDRKCSLYGGSAGLGRESVMCEVQKYMVQIVWAAMAFSIILYGFKVISLASDGRMPEQKDFVMNVLKYGLVIYFATGPGLAEFYQLAVDGVKDLSLIFFDASLKPNPNGTAYNYCSFYQEVYPQVAAYPYSNVRYSMDHLAIFDTIDCRVGKYLGIGEGTAPGIPKIFEVFIVPIFSVPIIGFAISALAVVYAVFTLGLVLRIVHVYIMALVGAIFMAFIGPIAIATLLFKYTESTFEKWLRQVMGFLLQPMILFLFLGVFFMVVDTIYWGGNTQFDSNNNMYLFDKDGAPVVVGNESIWEDTDKYKCADREAMACNIRYFTLGSFTIFGLSININEFDDIWSSAAFLLWGLLKFSLVAFMFNIMLGTVEGLSQTMTDSVADLSSRALPSASPGKTLARAASAPFKAYRGAKAVGGGIRSGAKGLRKRYRAARSEGSSAVGAVFKSGARGAGTLIKRGARKGYGSVKRSVNESRLRYNQPNQVGEVRKAYRVTKDASSEAWKDSKKVVDKTMNYPAKRRELKRKHASGEYINEKADKLKKLDEQKNKLTNDLKENEEKIKQLKNSPMTRANRSELQETKEQVEKIEKELKPIQKQVQEEEKKIIKSYDRIKQKDIAVKANEYLKSQGRDIDQLKNKYDKKKKS